MKDKRFYHSTLCSQREIPLKNKGKNYRRLLQRVICLLCILCLASEFRLPAETGNAANSPVLSYQTHVRKYGWMPPVAEGQYAGTMGKSMQIEAIRISLDNTDVSGTIQYRSHVSQYGWMDWKQNRQLSGTTGENKQMEAIQIKLTGNLEKKYDIYYRVHIQSFGWMDWAKNGETAGSVNLSKRMEAIQIVLKEKGSSAPGPTQHASFSEPVIYYHSHVQNFGWMDWKQNQQISGTTGMSKRMEAVQIKLSDHTVTGNVRYRTHVQTFGWTNWVNSDEISGTTGMGKRMEAIELKLEGPASSYYDIYYRVHAQSYGWMGWAKNGEPAGTEGMSKRLEAIQIVLVKKGGSAPGTTRNAFIQAQTSHIDPSKPMVALTFDDGPYRPVTTRILNALEKAGGHATFFVVGNRVASYSDVVKQAYQAGNEIGNHSWDHTSAFTKLSRAQIQSQVSQCNTAIQAITGKPPAILRPVGGSTNSTVLNSIGMPAVNWSIDTLDWKTRDAQSTINAVLNHVQDGDIILMHDLYPATATAAETIIPELKRRGYQLVTVSELAEYKGYRLKAGNKYYCFR